MRWSVLVLAVVLAAASVRAQSRYTVVAKTMSEAKIVPQLPADADVAEEPPVTADRDELLGGPIAALKAKKLAPVKPKPSAKAKAIKAKAAKVVEKTIKSAEKQLKKEKKADKKVKGEKKGEKKLKLQPGEASKAAKAAIPKAPKDQLIKWIRSRAPVGTTEADFAKLKLYLDGQLVHTFQDLLARGEEGIKSLLVGDKWRGEFMELLLQHIAKVHNADDGLMVPTHKLIKGGIPKKKSCHRHGEPRFASVPVKSNVVGDWLKRSFPDTKPLRMSRTILALERQAVKTFDDLRRLGAKGVKRLLYVPDGVRAALYEAVLYHIGTEGHDDGNFVAARRYVPPPPVKADDCN